MSRVFLTIACTVLFLLLFPVELYKELKWRLGK